MITFSGIEVWNAPISGNTAEYSPPALAPLLAGASKLLIQARTAQGSGSSPTLTVDIERSNDGLNFSSVGANAPISNVAVSTSGVTNAFAQWDTTASDNLFGCFVRLKISLGGTTPSANIRVVVTGRSKRPRRAGKAAVARGATMVGDGAACGGCRGAGCNCKTAASVVPNGEPASSPNIGSMMQAMTMRSDASLNGLELQPQALSLVPGVAGVGVAEFGCREVSVPNPYLSAACDSRRCPPDAQCMRVRLLPSSTSDGGVGQCCVRGGLLLGCSGLSPLECADTGPLPCCPRCPPGTPATFSCCISESDALSRGRYPGGLCEQRCQYLEALQRRLSFRVCGGRAGLAALPPFAS